MTPFRKAFLLTTIPTVALGLASTTVVLGLASTIEVFKLWFIGAGVFIVAVVMLVTLRESKEKSQIASGIRAGLAVGFVALATTCYANLASIMGQL